MPLDSGTRYVAQAAEARADLATAQPEIVRTQQRQRALPGSVRRARGARSSRSTPRRRRPQAAVDAARARIAGVAAQQYMHAGGARVNAAIDAAMNADDMLDLGRNLHILEKSGTHELDVFDVLEAAHAPGRRSSWPT